MNNFPSIGQPVLDPSEKHQENGVDKYDLPLADGGLIDEFTHPALFSEYAIPNYTEDGTLTASDASNADGFGISVALYGNRLVVGAYREATATTDAGKVYIYDWNGSQYVEVGQLTASDADYQDYFGFSVALYGNRLVVGAYTEDTATTDAGKVYIYDWNGSQYVEVGQLTASDADYQDNFGVSVALYGNRLVVGAYREDTTGSNAGKVYIYDWNGSQYVEVGQLTASDASNEDGFGISVALHDDRLIVGAYYNDTATQDEGKVYIYDWNGSQYVEVGQLTASDGAYKDNFGVSVALYGNRLVVGAYREDTATTDAGKVYIYDWNGSQYVEVGQLTASDADYQDYFGFSVALYDDRLVVGAYTEDTVGSNAGKVYYYDESITANRPNMTSPDPLCPYRIVADLTGGA